MFIVICFAQRNKEKLVLSTSRSIRCASYIQTFHVRTQRASRTFRVRIIKILNAISNALCETKLNLKRMLAGFDIAKLQF